MGQGRRYGLSAAQKADIWHRWKAGESLHEIGRAFGKDHGSTQFLLSQRGGIAPAFVAVRSGRSRWPSGRTSHEVLLPVLRFVRSPEDRSLCAGRSELVSGGERTVLARSERGCGV
jgi:hypothetical protein